MAVRHHLAPPALGDARHVLFYPPPALVEATLQHTAHPISRPLPPPPPTVNVVLPTPPAEATPTTPPSDAPRHICRLDGDPEAVRTARALVSNVLARWDPDLTEDAVLVTSELVTNALSHGRPPIILTVIGGHHLTVEVADASPELPIRELPGEIGHFGMWLAEELSTVSVHPGPYGKTVRATF